MLINGQGCQCRRQYAREWHLWQQRREAHVVSGATDCLSDCTAGIVFRLVLSIHYRTINANLAHLPAIRSVVCPSWWQVLKNARSKVGRQPLLLLLLGRPSSRYSQVTATGLQDNEAGTEWGRKHEGHRRRTNGACDLTSKHRCRFVCFYLTLVLLCCLKSGQAGSMRNKTGEMAPSDGIN